jgi:hypothetical protein
VKAGPVQIQGGAGGKSLNNALRKQRAGLLLNRGMLYVAFGGDITKRLEAPGESAGWIVVYDATDLSLQAIWTPTAKGANAGIWQSGRGLAADEDGYVYAVTGDGDFNADLQNTFRSLVLLSTKDGLHDYKSIGYRLLAGRCSWSSYLT